jgi:hypothetical protein
MTDEKKAKKRFFEKLLIYGVFSMVLAVFVFVVFSFILKIVNVEKNNPVLVAEDFSYATYDGNYYRSVDEAPDNLRVVEMRWFDGVRIDGESKFNQAFRDRFIYALYIDESGEKYIWVRDGDYYQEDYEWADWKRDYKQFNTFDNSYLYKEMKK